MPTRYSPPLRRVSQLWAALFFKHPKDVGETYFQHFFAAGRYAALLFFGSLAALTHAFIPVLCSSTARKIVTSIHVELANRVAAPADESGCQTEGR